MLHFSFINYFKKVLLHLLIRVLAFNKTKMCKVPKENLPHCFYSLLCLPPCAHLPLGLTLLLFPHLPVFPTGHGQCNCGRCDCKEGWAGKKCEHPLSCSLSLESSTRKCRGTSNLPCFGRGSRSFPIYLLCCHGYLSRPPLCLPLSIHKRQFPAFLTS